MLLSMKDYRAKLEPGHFYHVFNHSSGNKQLFFDRQDYLFFLEKCKKYILPNNHLFAYCLMPNHYHFLIKVKDESNVPNPNPSACFKNLFTSYAQYYNKAYQEKGSLFEPRFKRRKLRFQNEIVETVLYIHCNPVKHGLVRNLPEWGHSSFVDITRSQTSIVEKCQVIDWFEDLDNFIYVHNENLKKYL